MSVLVQAVVDHLLGKSVCNSSENATLTNWVMDKILGNCEIYRRWVMTNALKKSRQKQRQKILQSYPQEL